MTIKEQALKVLIDLVEEGKVLPQSNGHYHQTAFASWKVRASATVYALLPKDHRLLRTVEGIANSIAPQVPYFVGALDGLAKAIESGLLEELETQIVDKVSADDLTLAQEAFESSGQNPSYIASAVLAGSVLERALRRKCDSLGIAIVKPKGERKAMGALIDALKASDAISALREKQMRPWAAIRNDAAHGDFDKFTRADVQSFLRDLPAVLAELA